MKCVHCGKERPYRWVGGQHCHAPNKKAGKPEFVWPYPDWQGARPHQTHYTLYHNTRDYVYSEEDETQ